MRFGLDDSVIKKLTEVFEASPKVDKAYIFGSRAKGNFRADSDIDIAIKGYDLTLDDILKMSVAFEDKGINHRIDLLDYNEIKEPALIEHIDRVGVEFYSKWKEYKLEEIIDKFIDYRGKTPKKTTYGVPLITAKIVKDGKILEPNEFISEDDYESWMTRGFPEINDVVLTTEAPLGVVALLKDKNVALAQRIITLQTRKEICNSIFLKYYLESSEGQSALQSRASGSTVEGIKASELKKMTVFMPILPEQEKIGDVLKVWDDKIDLLNHQNKTLERLAETLFRQCFVEEAEEDVEIGALGNIIDLIYGKTLKEETRTGIGFPVIGSSGTVGYHSTFLVEAPGIVIGRKGTLGKVNYQFENFYPIDTTYFIKSKINSNGLFYEYFLLKSLNLEEMNSDSAVPGLNRDIALSAQIKMAPAEKINEFNNQCFVYFQKIKSNQNQIQALTKMRDTLLPKLMSGDVRVKMPE